MKIEALHIGMKVTHPHYGAGVVKALTERAAEVSFDDGVRTVAPQESGLERAEPVAVVNNLEVPLAFLIEDIAYAVASKTESERRRVEESAVIDELGSRWNDGRLVLHPSDPSLQPKEVTMETFFHKIVMMRNNLRVLEQKINGHDKLNDGEKVEMEQYINRCYGSMTTFNILFARKEDQFRSKAPEM